MTLLGAKRPFDPPLTRSRVRLALSAALALSLVAVVAPATFAEKPSARADQPTPREVARQFLASGGAGSKVARMDLRPARSANTNGTLVERFDQRYRGIPVLGAQYVVRLKHQGGKNVVTGGNGALYPDLAVDTRKQPTAEQARRVVNRALNGQIGKTHVTDNGLVILPKGPGILTRHLTVFGRGKDGPVRREFYVAFGGSRPVLAYDSLDFADGPVSTTGAGFNGPALPLSLYKRGSTYDFRDQSKRMFADQGGELLTYDAAGRDLGEVTKPEGGIADSLEPATTDTIPVAADKNANGLIDAAWGASLVYDYYKGLGRNSIDGNGGTVKSLVGGTYGGQPFPNAYWDGQAMVFGTGGFGFKPFSSSLDVIGHEMTHGVVQHTAGLIGDGQTGAINEAISDYFGNAIENKALGVATNSPDSGLLGEHLCEDRTGAECALRDVNTLLTTQEMQGEPFDGGGVHTNSTVVSGSLWDIRKQLGDDLTDRIVYKALSEYFIPSESFSDVRTHVLEAARDLGVTNAQRDIIRRAFDRHGIIPNWESKYDVFDSKQLFANIQYPGPIDVGGDRWVASHYGPNGSTIEEGSVTGLEQHEPIVSSAEGAFDAPATDGKRVAWAAYSWTDDEITVRIQWRGDDGAVETLAAYTGDVGIFGIEISGGNVVWSGYFDGEERAYIRTASGEVVELPTPAGGSSHSPRVDGNTVVYVSRTTPTGDPASDERLEVYDISTGTARVVASADRISTPVMTSSYIAYTEGGETDDPWMIEPGDIVRLNRDGSGRTVLVSRDDEANTLGFGLSASEDWLTYDSAGTSAPMAVRLAGGNPQRVTCSRGTNFGPAVTPAGRFVFLDTSASRFDVRMRRTPAGTC